MAWEGPQPVKLPGYVAGADLTALQYCFVRIDASNPGKIIAPSGQGADCVGVLQNKPNTGDACEIVATGISKLKYGATLDENGPITVLSTAGTADAAVAGDFVLGKALVAGVANDIGTAYIDCMATTIV